MTKILTTSVAAYNAEPFLNRCIDSLLIQEIINEIEIIIVNDGSTDNTLEIAQNYHTKYPDSIKLINKINGGYGSATNCAIDIASGKYFKILDADDWFNSEALITFIKFLENSDSDLVITHFSKEDALNAYSYPIRYEGIAFEEKYAFSSFCILDAIGEPGFAMHAMTYCTEILRKDNFHISECYYSDVDYSIYPLVHVHSLVFVDIVLYRYQIGREGQSVSHEGLIKHFDDHLSVCKKLVDYYTDYYSKQDSILSLNIGYKTASVMFNVISVIKSHIYTYNAELGMKLMGEFLNYLHEKDEDLFELAMERAR